MSRRSPLAHGPNTACGSCLPCPSCAGGTAHPTQYRVTRRPDGRLTTVCTRCHGRGVACHNLVEEDR